LALPPAQGNTTLPYNRLITLRETRNKVMCLRSFCGGDHLFVGGIRLAECDVLADRSTEQRGFLQNDADLGAQ